MRHYISTFVFVICAIAAQAQTAREDIKDNPYHGGDNYTAYIAPKKALTPAPKGYLPFYMSHYGRHGSRFLIGYKQYTRPLETLQKAHDDGKLTPRGEKLLEQFKAINDAVEGRQEELTPLGARQHREIAQRMYERFPTIFGGKAHIDAKSSVVIRCILSMSNELMILSSNNPKMDISMDASAHDMYYISQKDKKLDKKKPQNYDAEKIFKNYQDSLYNPERLMNVIFSSQDYWKENVKDPYQLAVRDIWEVAQDMQSTELTQTDYMLDIFTNDELYNIWLIHNAGWYINYGPSPLTGGRQIYRQRNLIRNIIQEADSCITLGVKTSGNIERTEGAWHGATMRFGHEVVVLPTVCFMNLDGYGTQYADLNDIVKNKWYDYRIFMMGSNIQLVFYKNPKGGDILVKALLNEEEATMPDLKPVNGPYYKWSDVKALWEKKLSEFKE